VLSKMVPRRFLPRPPWALISPPTNPRRQMTFDLNPTSNKALERACCPRRRRLSQLIDRVTVGAAQTVGIPEANWHG